MGATRELEPGPGDIDAPVRARLAHRSPGVRVAVVAVVAFLATTGTALALGWVVAGAGPDGPGGFDAAVTTWFARHRVDALRAVGTHLSTPTAPLVVIGLTVGAVAVLLRRRRWREATVVLVAVPLELSAYLATVTLVDRPRPDVVPLESAPATASFPSGHAAAAVALYGALAVVVRASATSGRTARWAVLAAAVVVAAVGVGRVYAGLHHPTDVAAGWAVGAAALAAAVLAARMVPEEPPGPTVEAPGSADR